MQPAISRLSTDFYTSPEVLRLSRELLGKVLVTNFDQQRTAGIIVETEAYRAPDDQACHAHLNRFTKRTKVMFMRGGHAYVYLIYGIHHMFNVVTGPEGSAHAILVRAIEPLENVDIMMERRNFTVLKPQLTAGPGVMTKAMGIHKAFTGQDMTDPDSPIWLEDHGTLIPDQKIATGPRIGIDYAGESIDWPWRFWLKGNKWVSRGDGLK